MKPICVIGGANVDLCGTPFLPVVPHDSNPGKVRISAGGVGRNIADSLACLGLPVMLLCALGRDEHGAFLMRHCLDVGIDMALTVYPEGGATSCYLCVNDHRGDLMVAVSDMDICGALTPPVLEGALGALNRCAMCVVDANVPEASIEFLARHLTVPLAADPVSVHKAVRLKPALYRMAALKPNLPEAQALTGQDARDVGVEGVALALHRMGVERVFLSLGARGAYYLDDQWAGRLPCLPGPVVDTTGCGDAFLAAALHAVVGGLPGQAAAHRALAAAAVKAAGRQVTLAAIDQAIKDGGII